MRGDDIIKDVDNKTMYCCHVDVNCYNEEFYKCPKQSDDLRGRMCSSGCRHWICNYHKEVQVCAKCGSKLT
jgi:hypothetical protein